MEHTAAVTRATPRFARWRALPGFALLAAACASEPSTAPSASPGAVRVSLMPGVTAAPIACGQPGPPVTVAVTTAGRGGRTVPVSGFLVNFRAADPWSSVFAGASITNAAGQASDRWTAGAYAGVPARIEVRSVDPGTAVPTTHLVVTHPVVMGPAKALVEYQRQAPVPYSGGGWSLTLVVETGCVGADGRPTLLPANTPWVLRRTADNSVASADVVGPSERLDVPWHFEREGMQYTLTVGNEATGTLSYTFTQEAAPEPLPW
jgi:hypothetical protein